MIDKNYSHNNATQAEEAQTPSTELQEEVKSPEMLKHMIQLNLRITNKTPQLAPGLFGLGAAERQFGNIGQPMGCAATDPAIGLPLSTYAAGRLQILPNYIEPIFKVEKVPSNTLQPRPMPVTRPRQMEKS